MSTDGQNSELNQLLQSCLQDDRQAQNQLYRRYYSLGMSIAMRYTSHQQRSKEILNDAFYKVFRSLERFDIDKDFKPWFCRIVVNTALNHVKSNGRFDYSSYDDLPSEPETVESVIADMSYQEVIALVQSLSLSYRTVFNLYVIDGFKHEEIADQLGISIGTSKSNLARAKANLRELIKVNCSTNHV